MTDNFASFGASISGPACTSGPLPIGQHSIWASRIWATGTTATGLTGWE